MDEKEPRIFKANHLLQAKVGMGSIDEKKIRKSQKLMDNVSVDFLSMAAQYLDNLHGALETARASQDTVPQKIQSMIEPVMQIKANAAMFGYNLIGTLASVMLNFLETLETVDEDVLAIVDAHHTTLKHLITGDMRGDGGDYGQELQAELKDACRRYFAKMASNRRDNDEEPFFVDG
jgi:chemotaxis protein histidine kinase CheA